MSAWRVLVVGDTENGTINDTLLDWGIHVIRCRRVSEGSKILGEQAVAQIFCDAKLPDGDYRDVVARARSVQPETRVVVIMPNGSAEHSFQEAKLAGAFDSIPSPAGRPCNGKFCRPCAKVRRGEPFERPEYTAGTPLGDAGNASGCNE